MSNTEVNKMQKYNRSAASINSIGTMKYNKGGGWHKESARHSLAARGITTKHSSQTRLKKYGLPQTHFKYPSSVKSLDKQQKIVSYAKEGSLMYKLQEFLHKKVNKAATENPEAQSDPKVQDMQSDIKHITNWNKFKVWFKKHEAPIVLYGLGGALGYAAFFSGIPTLMQNTATGEVIGVGGTLIGKWGKVGQTVLTGMAAYEEAKIINHDVLSKHEQTKLQDIAITDPQPKVFILKVKSDKGKIINYAEGEVSLAEISSKPIPYESLTETEKKTLNTAIAKTKLLLTKKGKTIKFNHSNLQICDRVGPDESAFGAHQGNLIQLERKMLKDKEKTEGVLLHESLHKLYGVRDETRDLENLQMDYLGLAMSNIKT